MGVYGTFTGSAHCTYEQFLGGGKFDRVRFFAASRAGGGGASGPTCFPSTNVGDPMTDGRSVRERIAGQSAMGEVVRAHNDRAPRGIFARLFGANPLHPSIRPSYRDAVGELVVGDILRNLGTRWDVLHDVPLGDWVLDHLAIGPAGVFAIVTANFSDNDVVIGPTNLIVAGEQHDDIQRARKQALDAATRLSAATATTVVVAPLLVLVQPRKVTRREAPSDLHIVASFEVDRFLNDGSAVLTGDEVAALSDIADLETTWPAALATDLDVQRLHTDFAMIRQEVNAALVRRVVWAMIGIGLAYMFMWGMISALVTNIMSS